MSTSDPHRPGGATDRSDETTDAGADATVSVRRGHDAGRRRLPGPRGGADRRDPRPADAERPGDAEPRDAAERTGAADGRRAGDPAEPVAGTIDASCPRPARRRRRRAAATTASTAEPSADTGRHAIVRPAPTPPDEPPPSPRHPSTTPPDPVRSPDDPARPGGRRRRPSPSP